MCFDLFSWTLAVISVLDFFFLLLLLLVIVRDEWYPSDKRNWKRSCLVKKIMTWLFKKLFCELKLVILDYVLGDWLVSFCLLMPWLSVWCYVLYYMFFCHIESESSCFICFCSKLNVVNVLRISPWRRNGCYFTLRSIFYDKILYEFTAGSVQDECMD